MTFQKIEIPWLSILPVLIISFHLSNCIDYVIIDEIMNFSPCSFSNETLFCNANSFPELYRNKTLKFSKAQYRKISKLELINFEMQEIPAYFFQEISGFLVTIRIVSKSPIKVIDPLAFADCNRVMFLEIFGSQSSENFSLDFSKVTSPLRSLEEIRLININIRKLEADLFALSTNLRSVMITSSVFTSISTKAFQMNTKLSSLSFNGMKNATDFMQTLENWPPSSKLMISSLNLDNCDITKFPKLSINIAENISQLSLAKNPIEQILLEDIGPLKKLESLSLQSTKITVDSVPGLRLLTNLKDLRLIDLETLTDIPKEVENMESLESIFLDMSKFLEITVTLPSSIKKVSAANLQKPTTIRSNFLSKCRKLNILLFMTVPNDNIKFIMDNRAVINSSLSVLSLDNSNLMKNELMELLFSLSNLEILHLSNANLNYITDEVLFNMRNLKKLILKGNAFRYETINTEGFQRVSRNLLQLDLSLNQLNQLPSCMFHLFPNFQGLQVLNNYFVCDCRMLWLYETVKKKGVNNPQLNFSCNGWPNGGRFFSQLSERDLTNCSTQTIDNCIPSKGGLYIMSYISSYNWTTSVLSFTDINGYDLKFLFDYFTITIKQGNSSFHSESDKFDLRRRSIDVGVTLRSSDIEVCLILNRKGVEYKYAYNCQSVALDRAVLQGNLKIVTAVTAVAGTLILIAIIVIVVCCQRWRKKKKDKQHDYYEASSTEYSEPDDTYKSPDQYTYVSDGQYNFESSEAPSVMSHNTFPGLPVSEMPSRLAIIPSKSLDNVMNSSKESSDPRKTKFRKRSRIANLIFKARSSTNLLDRPRLSLPVNDCAIIMQDLKVSTNQTLPRQYAGRALPQTPADNNPGTNAIDCPPPKPRLSNSSIQNILNNADQHFKNFSQYISNNSLYTDESANNHHSGDSGLGISKITDNPNQSMSDII